MKNIVKILAVVVFCASISFIGGCQKEEAKVKQEVINVANLPELLDKIKADEAFKKEDIDLFVQGLGRFAATLDSVNGKTVGQIINLEKDFLRKSSLLGLTTTAMNIVQGFGYVGWQPLEQADKKYFQFGFAIQNKTKEDFKNVEGLLKFVTANNQLIKAFRIKIEQGVPAGKVQQYNSTFIMDQSNKNDILLNDVLVAKNPNVYTVWEPTLIEFAGGKKIVKDNPVAAK